jgi:hypothetical protein
MRREENAVARKECAGVAMEREVGAGHEGAWVCGFVQKRRQWRGFGGELGLGGGGPRGRDRGAVDAVMGMEMGRFFWLTWSPWWRDNGFDLACVFSCRKADFGREDRKRALIRVRFHGMLELEGI